VTRLQDLLHGSPDGILNGPSLAAERRADRRPGKIFLRAPGPRAVTAYA